MIKKSFSYRFWEIFPGALTWTALLLPLILSFFLPAGVAIFIILFDLYWLYKSTIMGAHLISGYNFMKHEKRIHWLDRLKELPKDQYKPSWHDIYHVYMLATYREDIEILRASIQSAVDSDFPLKQIILVLAIEERDKENARQISQILKKEFDGKFYDFIITEHPDDIAGELKAKGANLRWAGKKLEKYLKEKKFDFSKVIVTAADADTRVHPKYFSCLTYKFLLEPDPLHCSFQPIPIYANNIWEAPALCRVIAFSSSFWQMIEATRPWRLINFATHAMSMQTLVEIDFWETSCVNEDSRQFWRGYFKFQGDHKVVPVFVPVYMDAVLSDNFWLTLKNQYKQKQRWAYGIEHLPYIMKSAIKDKTISFWDKAVKIYRLIEGNFSWATASFFIAFVGWLPLWFGPGFRSTVLAMNLPFLARILLALTWIGLLISATISILLLPTPPPGYKKNTLKMIAQWILIPIVAIFFSSIPAIDAQTHLMLGKYLGFWTTPKTVKKQ